MLNSSMNKKEIEDFLNGKGDFVQIDHLTRFLTRDKPPLEKRKFVFEKLAEIYEKKRMFQEAAKMWNNISLSSLTFKEKMQSYVKEAELFIKAGKFDEADEAVKKALGDAHGPERDSVTKTIKAFYKEQALVYEKENRRSNAAKIYEKLLEMSITPQERQEIKEKLLPLYERLGRVTEYFTLKKS